MIRYIYIVVIGALMTLALASCDKSQDVEAVAIEVTGAYETVEVPVSVVMNMPLADDGTRAAVGDPGMDDRLAAPTHVYIWAVVQREDAKWDIAYQYRMFGATEWAYNQTETNISRYTSQNVKLALSNMKMDNNADIGKFYAIASKRELTDEQLRGVYTGAAPFDTYMNATAYKDSISNLVAGTVLDADPSAGIKAALIDLSGWTPTQLRDLYSSPYLDTQLDANGRGNGVIYNDANGKHRFAQINMYHCAAKVDFNWEVAAANRATTSLKSITCTALPTTCKVFAPTQNPATKAGGGDNTDATCKVIAAADAENTLTTANKWQGRAYSYVLQPATRQIPYTVTFDGKADVATHTQTGPSEVFTTWYLVRARI